MTRSRPLAAALALALALIPETALADPPPTKSACAAANESAQHAWQAHQLLRARADLLACVTDTCPAPVRQDCARRLDEVEVSTPSIVFEIRDVAGGDVPRASISIDGEPPAPNSGAAVDLDPGEHSIRFEAPGFGPSTDIHWTFDDDDWCEVGDQTRLRVSEGLPVEIETFSLDLDAAVTAAEQAYDHPICLVGDWVRHASGRSTVFVAVIA